MNDESGVLQKIPVAAVGFSLAAIGFLAGLALFPIPPYSNVGPAASVPLVLVFGGTLAFLEVQSRGA